MYRSLFGTSAFPRVYINTCVCVFCHISRESGSTVSIMGCSVRTTCDRLYGLPRVPGVAFAVTDCRRDAVFANSIMGE